jgi:hypothetical protein
MFLYECGQFIMAFAHHYGRVDFVHRRARKLQEDEKDRICIVGRNESRPRHGLNGCLVKLTLGSFRKLSRADSSRSETSAKYLVPLPVYRASQEGKGLVSFKH